jgi:hypothetical protein
MIELLNEYRAVREGSESAAKKLGYAFGQAFEIAYRDVGEVQVSSFDNITRPDQLTIENLKSQILGSRTLFAQAFGDVIRRDPTNHKYSVGIRFPNDSKVTIEGSEVVLHEAPFVQGFIEGFRQSRSSAAHQHNGSPALTASR